MCSLFILQDTVPLPTVTFLLQTCPTNLALPPPPVSATQPFWTPHSFPNAPTSTPAPRLPGTPSLHPHLSKLYSFANRTFSPSRPMVLNLLLFVCLLFVLFVFRRASLFSPSLSESPIHMEARGSPSTRFPLPCPAMKGSLKNTHLKSTSHTR